ncbi:hypothetical protein QBC40DRAFT_10161 [Triangularia verruculosa]|uniref:NmrA-like domain-containing protein n=1 Tax=Triangularia verruculosa TaxID=2587418 RepID=A0AAN7ASV5_9PEZI|nr:hypothetical protein QBC40DRAFT_10161 [Triangularia verruculosa]
MASNTILVVGATGRQGGAVVKALLDLPAQNLPIRILALTRNAQSKNAKKLAESHKGVLEIIQGDSSQPKPIFKTLPKGSVDGLFIVTVPPMDDRSNVSEEDQALPLIDAAVEHGVKHIVFTSVERGGDEKSWSNPTNVPRFIPKHNIELYLRDKAEKEQGKFTWTILRPVAYLENFKPGIFCSVFTAMWATSLSPTTKLQLVSVRDIGKFAAKAFVEPVKWSNKALGLAGVELTLPEARERFREVTGNDLPEAWGLFGRGILWIRKEVGMMFQYFEDEGCQAVIEERRKDLPELQDFEAWLKDPSNGWTK